MVKSVQVGSFVALVDDEDYEIVSRYRWAPRLSRGRIYAQRNVSENGKRRVQNMHHDIAGSPPPGMVTDHKDCNGLNNQRTNLRNATFRQNAQNKKCRADSRSGVKGLRQSDSGNWNVRIWADGTVRSGTFKTKQEAAEAYARWAVEKFGEFARTE